MNNKQTWVLTLLTIFVLTGCGEEANTTQNDASPAKTTSKEAPKPIIESIPFDPDAVYLERMYATSNGEAGPEMILDGDQNTNWQAMPGAGPDEGIMLYFEEPTEVSKLEINSKGISRYQCFVNGSDAGYVSDNGTKEIDQAVSSLYLRIVDVPNETKKELDGDDWLREYKEYPEDMRVGIGEVKLFDKDEQELKVRPLHLEPGKASSTSTLSPEEAYHADYLFDSKLEFGWAEGSDDHGVGEKLTFSFEKAVKIEKIKVWNGYQRSNSHFERNARAKSISFGASGGANESYQLEDRTAPTTVELATPLEGSTFELKIEDFYEGKSYKDLVLSELRFYDGQQWFGVKSSGEEERKAALKEKVSGTVLEDLLDRPLNDSYEHEYEEQKIESRLILRSNGSFVLYRTRNGQIKTNEKKRSVEEVADGNWSIETLSSGKAEIKIFGKLQRIMEKEDWYKGKSKSDRTRIFSEILTITPKEITGQKLIEILRLTEEGTDPHPIGVINTPKSDPISGLMGPRYYHSFMVLGDA